MRIHCDKEGAVLISRVCDMALKGVGISGLQDVSNLMNTATVVADENMMKIGGQELPPPTPEDKDFEKVGGNGVKET